MAWDQRVEVDEPREAIGDALGDAADDVAVERVADEHDVVERFGLEVCYDVGNPRAEVDGGVVEVRTIAGAGEGDGMWVMAGRAQERGDARPCAGS